MKSYFFNAEPTADLVSHPTGYDREYDADDHAEFFAPFFTQAGVMGRDADSCKVTAAAENTLRVCAGCAYVRGRMVKFDGTETIAVTGDCIIVARMNKSADVRAFQLLAVQELMDTPDICDLELARVVVGNGGALTLTDTRTFMAFTGQPAYYPPDSDELPYALWLYTLGFPMTAEQRAAVEDNESLMEIFSGSRAQTLRGMISRTVTFEASGTFDPAAYSLRAGDRVHVVCIGGGSAGGKGWTTGSERRQYGGLGGKRGEIREADYTLPDTKPIRVTVGKGGASSFAAGSASSFGSVVSSKGGAAVTGYNGYSGEGDHPSSGVDDTPSVGGQGGYWNGFCSNACPSGSVYITPGRSLNDGGWGGTYRTANNSSYNSPYVHATSGNLLGGAGGNPTSSTLSDFSESGADGGYHGAKGGKGGSGGGPVGAYSTEWGTGGAGGGGGYGAGGGGGGGGGTAGEGGAGADGAVIIIF